MQNIKEFKNVITGIAFM